MLGLERGDAHIIRNAGGLVTEDVIRSLSASQRLLGTEEIVVVMHDDCGLHRASEVEFAQALAADGVLPTWRLGTFDDVEATLRNSLARLRSSPELPARDHIRGLRLRPRGRLAAGSRPGLIDRAPAGEHEAAQRRRGRSARSRPADLVARGGIEREQDEDHARADHVGVVVRRPPAAARQQDGTAQATAGRSRRRGAHRERPAERARRRGRPRPPSRSPAARRGDQPDAITGSRAILRSSSQPNIPTPRARRTGTSR